MAKNDLTFLKSFSIYFLINFVLLLLTWPGGWFGVDSLQLYIDAVNMNFTVWHHVLTSLFYIVSLKLIPFPAGIVVMEILFASLVAGYAVSGFHRLYPSKYTWGLFIPLCLPMVLANNLHPLRFPLYAYTILLFFLTVIFKYIRKKELCIKDMVVWGALGALIVNWRAEGIVYFAGIPILLAALFYHRFSLKKASFFLLIFFGLGLGIASLQNKASENLNPNLYHLIGLSQILQDILTVDFKSNDKEADLQTISNTINIDKFLDDPDAIAAVKSAQRKTIPKFRMRQLEATLAKLIIYNFPHIMKNRLAFFERTNRANMYLTRENDVFNPKVLEKVKAENSKYGENYSNITIDLFKNKPFNNNLRLNILLFLNSSGTGIYPVSVFLILFLTVGIVRRDKLVSLISGLMLVQFFFLLLFMPEPQPLYFLSIYMCIYVFLAMSVIKWHVERKHKRV